MGDPLPIFQPLQTWTVDLPFRPALWQRLLVAATSPLARVLPVPRSEEIATLAGRIGAPTTTLPRRLFRHALQEGLFLVSGGWRQLDLSPLRDTPDPWTRCGQPTLFLSMHHGNWEWLAGILHHLRKDTLGVARAAHQRPGQMLLNHVRAFHQTPIFYNQAGVRAAHKTLRQGGLVAFLADQRPPTQGEPGTWLGQPTRVSPLPRRWCQGIEPDIWTGHLLPEPTRYRLTLERYPAEVIHHWDLLLDQTFLPLVHQSPDWHFGLFHNRLVPRETFSGAQTPPSGNK
jgi:hypothetical protein